MQNLILSCALVSLMLPVWIVHFLMSETHYYLDLEAPPSAFGPPHVLLKKGSRIECAFCTKEDFIPSPHPVFVNRFYISKDAIDELRVTSNVPPEDVASVSARLYAPSGDLLASWPASVFKPVSLEQAESALEDHEADFALGTVLRNSAFDTSISPNLFTPGVIFMWSGLTAAFYLLFQSLPFYRKYLLSVCKKLNQPLIVRSNISSLKLWLYCFVGMAVISISAWSVFGLRYVTTDDPFMAQIASGYLLDHPEWHLFFTHPIVGLFLKTLYSTSRDVPFYSALMVGLNTLGLTTVIYSLLRRSLDLRRLVGCAILTTVAGLFLITRIQFTMVSSSLALAGILLILSGYGETQISRTRLVSAILLFLAAFAIRPQIPPFLLALTVPCALCLLWGSSFPGAKRFLLAVVTGMVLLALTEQAAYKSSPAWADAKSFDIVRGKLHSTEVMKSYDDNRSVFQAVGWSPNDLSTFNFFLSDNSLVFSKDKLTYLVEHLKQPTLSRSQQLSNVVMGLLRSANVVFLFMIWLLIAWVLRLLPRLPILVLAATWLAGMAYLILFIRLPERVFAPIMFAELSVLLLLSAVNRPIYQLRAALFGFLFLLLIHLPILAYALSGLYQNSVFNEERRHATISALTYLSNIHYAPVIVNSIPGTALEQTYLWQNFSEIQKLKLFPLPCFESPVANQRSARLGIHNVFFDLAHRSDMVLAVARWDLQQITVTETFIREHNGERIKFELAKIPGTNHDAVFPYFSLFKVKIDQVIPPS